MTVNFMKWFTIGAIAGALNIVLLWAVSFVAPLAQFVTGVNTELGNIVQNLVSGVAPFASTLPVLVVAAIGGGLLVMLGAWIHDQKWSPKFGKGAIVKVATILIYGSIGATIVLSLPNFALPVLTVLMALVINSLITAWFIVQVLDKTLSLVKVP